MRWHQVNDREHEAADGRERGTDAAFWASPVGRAARAKLRGDRFFQIELDGATLTEYAETSALTRGGRRARRTCDLLGQIEELGWRLEHVTWWRSDADQGEPALPAARPGSDHDHVRGVYLFHSEPVVGADATADTSQVDTHEHAPTHRADVG